jgi:hypothetical protein
MVTASHLIEKEIKNKPLLQEAIMQGIISYQALAEKLHPKIINELGKDVTLSAIIMALRRYSEKLETNFNINNFNFDSEVIMKNKLADFCFLKSNTIFLKLNNLYKAIDYKGGDTFNVIDGNYEITIIANSKYKKIIEKNLKDEKMIFFEDNLSSITLKFSKDFITTRGIIYEITRKFSWNNINVLEIVSTMTELTLIVQKKDSIKAYESIIELSEKNFRV